MKIEKLSESKIKFTVYLEDMERWGISLESLAADTPKARELFNLLIKRAEIETGFSAANSRLMIEAQPGKDDAIVLFITNLDMQQAGGKMRVRAKAAPDRKNKIFIFDDFENLCTLASVNKNDEGGTLYTLDGRYYLVLNSDCAAGISEYGKETKRDEITLSYLNEHGKCIIERDALKTIEKYFK